MSGESRSFAGRFHFRGATPQILDHGKIVRGGTMNLCSGSTGQFGLPFLTRQTADRRLVRSITTKSGRISEKGGAYLPRERGRLHHNQLHFELNVRGYRAGPHRFQAFGYGPEQVGKAGGGTSFEPSSRRYSVRWQRRCFAALIVLERNGMGCTRPTTKSGTGRDRRAGAALSATALWSNEPGGEACPPQPHANN